MEAMMKETSVKPRMASLGTYVAKKPKSLDPRKFPDEHFELFSVPSHADGKPEVVEGKTVGASKQMVEDDTVLLCKINPRINRTWVVSSHTNHRKIASSEWMTFPPHPDFLPKYMGYYLRQDELREYLSLNASGVGGSLMRAKPSLIKDYPFPLFSLPEQGRIVEAIELQLGRLDAAVARLHAAKAKLKRYKQAVLKAAFSGRLSGSYQEGQELPDDWNLATTDDLFQYVTSGSRGWAKYYADKGALFLRITNMDFDTLELDLAPEKIQRVHLNDVREGTRTRVQRGDLLISITGYLGMIALVDKDIEEAYVNQHIALARPLDHFNKHYVGYYLTAEEGGRRQFNLAGKGATKAGLTLPDIKALRVPMAPRHEQDHIVKQIEHLLSAVNHSESTLDAQFAQSTRLRQSILKRAFEGRLV